MCEGTKEIFFIKKSSYLGLVRLGLVHVFLVLPLEFDRGLQKPATFLVLL